MEEHYIKDVGKITYVYDVNLEEHKTVIEKQQKRIAELEQKLAELKEKYNKASEKLKNLTEEVENNFVHGQDYEKLKQELEETNAGYDFTYEQSTEAIKELKQNQTQLAIQELEKVKAKVRDVSGVLALCEIEVQIDQQIKELKGE